MSARAWAWSLVMVASLHLLTTPGRWILTDQAEYILMGERLLSRGSFDLAAARETPARLLPWIRVERAGEPVRSRLLPLTSITLLPLLALDRVLGTGDPIEHGAAIHLQGHLFVLAGLGVLGWTIRRQASAAAACIAVALTGLCWPVWQVSRRGGPEAIYVLLVCLFIAGQSLEAEGGRPGRTLAAIACALVPWGNPTGPVLGATLLGAAGAERALAGRPLRRLLLPATAYLSSLAVLVVFWNHYYQGHWLLGGYARYAVTVGWLAQADPLRGLGAHVRVALLTCPVLILVAVAGVLADPPGRRARLLLVPVCLTAAMLLLFAGSPELEPARRLAAVWPAWGAVVGRTWDRLRWPQPLPQLVLAAAFLLGFYWFMAVEGRYHLGPAGLYYPSVLWVWLWIESRPAWQYALPAVLLTTVFVWAAIRVRTLLVRPPDVSTSASSAEVSFTFRRPPG